MRRRGNPDWGKLPLDLPAVLTEFDLEVQRLRLTPAEYAASPHLRRWCEQNRNRYYVPEWLRKTWRLAVDAIGDVA